MKLTLSKQSIILVAAALLGAAALLISILIARRGYGHLEVRVVDAYTLMPVAGAYVALPQAGRALLTDGGGACSFTGIRINAAHLFSGIGGLIPGECALLATMEGYRPTVLLYAYIKKDEMRRVTLYLFPEEADAEEIITISQAPDMDWLRQFVKTYSP